MKNLQRAGAISLVQIAMLTFAHAAIAAPNSIYVANEGDSTVSVIDIATFKPVRKIQVGRNPHNVQLSPDGKFAWVTNDGSHKPDENTHQDAAKHGQTTEGAGGEVWAIDTQTDRVVTQIGVGVHPAHVVITPDGSQAYVTNGGEGTVSIVDLQAQKVIATVKVGSYPHGIRMRPDGKQAYVANLKSDTVSVIDTASRKQVAEINVGKGPAQVGFTPDGSTAFVSLSGEAKVALIDPLQRKVISKIGVESVPIQVYATPDNKTVIVANQGSKANPGKTVSFVDIATRRVVKTVETGKGAHGVVVDERGDRAYVTNTYANTVSAIDIRSGKVVATTPVGEAPNGISMLP